MKIERIHTQEELSYILENTVPEPNRQIVSQTYNYMRGQSKDRLEKIVSSFQKVLLTTYLEVLCIIQLIFVMINLGATYQAK